MQAPLLHDKNTAEGFLAGDLHGGGCAGQHRRCVERGARSSGSWKLIRRSGHLRALLLFDPRDSKAHRQTAGQDENARLKKKMMADLTLDRGMLQDVIWRKLRSLVACANWFA